MTLREGQAFPSRRSGPLTRVEIARYAGAGGDFNPLHTDEEFAVASGFPSVFAMGLLGAGILAQALARWVGPQNVRAYSVRFTGQVWPGDTLAAQGFVDQVDCRTSPRTASLKLTLSRQTGETVLTGGAVVVMEDELGGESA